MDGNLHAALDALEESRDDPAMFSQSFVDILPITGAAVSTMGAFLGNQTVSASDVLAAQLDELQFDLGEGPCWDAVRLARPVHEPDLRTSGRDTWPLFSRAMEDKAVASLFAFPLLLGALRIGAVDLYSAHRVELDATQSRNAEALAGVVGRHVLRRALDSLGREHESQETPYSRRLIHQATGMVLAQLRLPPDDALLVIEGHSYATGQSVMEVARDIVDRKLVFSQSSTGIEST